MKLGDRVKDTLTGFEGILVGKTEWLYGCIRVSIEPTELKDGKRIEPDWFDEQRVVRVKKSKPSISADSVATTGGPQKDPRR